jgi:hypothetical protein
VEFAERNRARTKALQLTGPARRRIAVEGSPAGPVAELGRSREEAEGRCRSPSSQVRELRMRVFLVIAGLVLLLVAGGITFKVDAVASHSVALGVAAAGFSMGGGLCFLAAVTMKRRTRQ